MNVTASKYSKKRPDITPSKENDRKLAKILWLLAEEYKLTNDELSLLLDVKLRTIQDARGKKSLPNSSYDRYRRVGLMLGIKKNLEILYPKNPEVCKNWLRVEREVFKGRSAIELIMENPVESMARLFTVRRLLDMQRNGTIEALI
jgi:hypothetical protein